MLELLFADREAAALQIGCHFSPPPSRVITLVLHIRFLQKKQVQSLLYTWQSTVQLMLKALAHPDPYTDLQSSRRRHCCLFEVAFEIAVKAREAYIVK